MKDAEAHVGVQLPHEGREVVVLEVLGQHFLAELRRLPHDEAEQTTSTSVNILHLELRAVCRLHP